MGSIAFGALIIAIVQMVKALFMYMRKKIEAMTGNNACVKCLLCATFCCIKCLDCCVKFITKNAYIQVAITNKSFCASAWGAFCLIVRNVGRFAVIGSIGAILMFVGKALICTLSGFIGYLILMNTDLKDKINSPILPTIVIVVIAYLISSIFLSVYSFSSTAILHSFFLDEEIEGNHKPQCLAEFVKNHVNPKESDASKQAIAGKGDDKSVQDTNVMK